MPALATLVDTDALWRILVVVLLVGVGATAIFGAGVRSLEGLEHARRDGRPGAVAGHAVVLGAAAAVSLALLVLGFVAMTHK